MSHYTEIKTAFKDQAALIDALVEIGFARGSIEVHEAPVTLYGHHGDERPERAEIVIRRHYLSIASNDIGFARQADGTFQAIISEYDEMAGHHAINPTAKALGGYNAAWLGRVKQAYAARVVEKQAASRGLRTERRKDAAGRIVVTVSGV